MLTTSKGLRNPNLCKICGSRNLKSFAHTAKCANCGVLLYYPYPTSDSDLDKDGVGKYSPQESFLNGIRKLHSLITPTLPTCYDSQWMKA
jgi:hypothetical protein